MQKITEGCIKINQQISTKKLLSWKWAVYDSMLIGVLVAGVLFNIH